MTRVPVNGMQLNVETAGSGPAVVALHGFTGSISTWERFAREAQRRYRVVLIDLPGHGGSDSPDDCQKYSVQASAMAVAAVLDHLGIPSACWMGYSMGGRIALVAATLVPQKCSCLVLEGASPGIADAAERARRLSDDEQLARVIEDRGVEAFVDYWEKLPLFASREQLAPAMRRRLRKQRLRNSSGGLANTLRAASPGAQPPVHDRLPGINVPVLCIAGKLDMKFRAIAGKMCRALPQGRLAIIPGAGHAAHLERPEEFNAAVLGFLGQVMLSPGRSRSIPPQRLGATP